MGLIKDLFQSDEDRQREEEEQRDKNIQDDAERTMRDLDGIGGAHNNQGPSSPKWHCP